MLTRSGDNGRARTGLDRKAAATTATEEQEAGCGRFFFAFARNTAHPERL